MGLKTTNFHIKKFDLTLPTAYAKLRTLVLNSNGTVSATFSIQQSRAHCDNYEPIDVVKVETKTVWDRNIPLEKFAYEAARNETQFLAKRNEKGETYTETEYGTLYGWDNDIVEKKDE